MKIEKMTNYESPEVEVIEVEVESGFATSSTSVDGSSTNEPMEGGNGTGTFPW